MLGASVWHKNLRAPTAPHIQLMPQPVLRPRSVRLLPGLDIWALPAVLGIAVVAQAFSSCLAHSATRADAQVTTSGSAHHLSGSVE